MGSKSSIKKKCFKSSGLARKRRDKGADSKTGILMVANTSKEADAESFANYKDKLIISF